LEPTLTKTAKRHFAFRQPELAEVFISIRGWPSADDLRSLFDEKVSDVAETGEAAKLRQRLDIRLDIRKRHEIVRRGVSVPERP
jgi:hypothetical protein